MAIIPLGEPLTWAATVPVPTLVSHSYSLPSTGVQPVRFSPHIANDHIVAGSGTPKSGRASP